jgi:hypothetical protein
MIPYEQLNSMLVRIPILNPRSISSPLFFVPQNAAAAPDRHAYLKGVQHVKPDISTIRPVFDELVSRAQNSTRSIAILLEYWPLEKIMSVPTGDSALHRVPHHNVLITQAWGEENAEVLKSAQETAREFGKQLSQDGLIGYGNYGRSLHGYFAICVAYPYSLLQTTRRTPDSGSNLTVWCPRIRQKLSLARTIRS